MKERDEPSELALSISAKLQTDERVVVSDAEMAELSVYEQSVLIRTATRAGYVAWYFPSTGVTTFMRYPANERA